MKTKVPYSETHLNVESLENAVSRFIVKGQNQDFGKRWRHRSFQWVYTGTKTPEVSGNAVLNMLALQRPFVDIFVFFI